MYDYKPKGWIRLHRDLESQSIFKDSETMRLYIYLICRAVTEPITFRGIEISRGQTVTTYRRLANELQLAVHRVRAIVERLVDAHYLTHSTAHSGAHSFSIITICDYDKYQGAKRASSHINPHNDSHNNPHLQSSSTLYIGKEISTNVDREEEKTSPSSDFEKVLIEKLIDDDVWKGKIAGTFGLDETSLIKRLDEFFISNECRGKFHKDLSDLKSHFVNWLKIILNPKQQNNSKYEDKHAARRSTDVAIEPGEDDSTF